MILQFFRQEALELPDNWKGFELARARPGGGVLLRVLGLCWNSWVDGWMVYWGCLEIGPPDCWRHIVPSSLGFIWIHGNCWSQRQFLRHTAAMTSLLKSNQGFSALGASKKWSTFIYAFHWYHRIVFDLTISISIVNHRILLLWQIDHVSSRPRNLCISSKQIHRR